MLRPLNGKKFRLILLKIILSIILFLNKVFKIKSIIVYFYLLFLYK